MKIFARGDHKVNMRVSEMLDEPVFECKTCKILFAIKYLPVFDVIYCPRCAASLGNPTTLRKKYLEGEA